MTPPWRFKLKNAGNGYLIIDAEEKQLCDVYMTNLKSVAEGRARLMAAAPDLLEACKNFHTALDMAFAMLIEAKPDFYPSKSGMWAAMIAGNKAIGKAEGR